MSGPLGVPPDRTLVALPPGDFGLATCFGASTVMLGSGAAEPVAVCDTAVPLKLHSNDIDKIAIAEGATKPDGNSYDHILPNPGRTCPQCVHDTVQTSLNFRIRRLRLAMYLPASRTSPGTYQSAIAEQTKFMSTRPRWPARSAEGALCDFL